MILINSKYNDILQKRWYCSALVSTVMYMLILCKHLYKLLAKLKLTIPAQLKYISMAISIASYVYMYQQVFGCVLMYTSQVYAFSSYVYNNLLSIHCYCYNQFISNVISCRFTDLVYISLCNYFLILDLHSVTLCSEMW